MRRAHTDPYLPYGSARRARPQIAIIGSGLAGEALATRLSKFCDVTVYERGGACGRSSPDIISLGRPLGLHETMSYGLGGTTALWRGCMLDMERNEFGLGWPDIVRSELPQSYVDFVTHLAGSRGGMLWSRRTMFDLSSDGILIRSLFVPAKTPRLARSSIWRDVTVRTNCVVKGVEEGEGGVSVIFSDDSGWQRQSYDLAIVCAGALNTPSILRKSGICSSHAGRNLTDHPMGLVAKLKVGDPVKVNAQLARPNGLRTIYKVKDEVSGLWSSFQLCPTHDASFAQEHYLENANGDGARSLSARTMYEKLKNRSYREMWINKSLGRDQIGTFAYVLAILEQESDGCGWVSADDAGRFTLSWTISDSSVAALTRSLHKLAAWLGADLHLPPTGVCSRLWSGAHHAGTCRISLSGETGIVDGNLRVHDRQRIYVCDASVLPSTGASHTGLTIGSLAMRLADHLHLQFLGALAERA